MKKILPLIAMAAVITLLASSCRKYVDAPAVPPLSGQWYLQNAARYDNYHWQTIQTGYEDGSFYFRSNGSLVYTDALGNLSGSWNMYPATGGYYDGNGNYREGYHTVFSLVMYEPGNQQPAATWQFSDTDYDGGSSFMAIYNTGGTTYEFHFVRE